MRSNAPPSPLRDTLQEFTPLAPAPWWMRGESIFKGHVQTIWTALYAKPYVNFIPQYTRERWSTPDQDFIDVDWLSPEQPAQATPKPLHTNQPLMVLFHGLEGSSQSNYALAMADWCARHGWAFAVPHFRSCSGDINRATRIYHMSDYIEADWILKRFKTQHAGPLVAMGVSLGANVRLRWVVEAQQTASQTLHAAACICAPLDLVTNAKTMDNGFCKWVYTERFLKTLREKAEYKIKQYPGLFDIQAVRQAKTFAEFDNLMTAPLHGFKNQLDYWTQCSIHADMLDQARIPTLLMNTVNDPFIPIASVPHSSLHDYLTFYQANHGGHLGFAAGYFPGSLAAFTETVGSYLQHHLI